MRRNQTVVIVLGLAILTGLLLAAAGLLVDRDDQKDLANQAWGVFEGYIDAAEANDLGALSELSWRLSPACQAALGDDSEEQMLECRSLMDNVASIAGNLSREDFPYLADEGGQVSIYSDYTEGTRVVLSFVRTESDELKVSGIMFCTEGSEPVAECFDEEVPPTTGPPELDINISPETIQDNFNSLFPAE